MKKRFLIVSASVVLLISLIAAFVLLTNIPAPRAEIIKEIKIDHAKKCAKPES